jgi:hypothetical protein
MTEAQQNLRAAIARIAAGAATRSDSLRSVIAVGNQQIAVLTAENELENANATLTRLVGTPFVVTAVEADTGLVVPVATSPAELTAMLETIPSIRAARATLDASQPPPERQDRVLSDVSRIFDAEERRVDGFDFGLGSPSPHDLNAPAETGSPASGVALKASRHPRPACPYRCSRPWREAILAQPC